MRRSHRVVATAMLLALAGALSGCGGMSAWDPYDLLDFLDTKKPVPGERKPVFPEGVPGATQGVPREMIRGTPEYEAARNANVAVGTPVENAPPPAAEPPSRGKAKGKAGRKTALRPAVEESAPPPPADDAEPVQETAPAAPPPSQRRKTARRQPVQPAEQAAPVQPPRDQQASPFPNPNQTR